MLVREAIIGAATELHQLEREVMEIAGEVSTRIELSVQTNKVLRLGGDISGAIQQKETHLLQMNHIPGNLMEADRAIQEQYKFRSDCEVRPLHLKELYNAKINEIFGRFNVHSITSTTNAPMPCFRIRRDEK